MKENNRRLQFKRDSTNMLSRRFYNENYSLYKNEIYEILIKRITRKIPINQQSDLLKFIRREKLRRIFKLK